MRYQTRHSFVVGDRFPRLRLIRVAVAVGLLCLGCQPNVEMGEPINMGPFTFEVDSASAGPSPFRALRSTEIRVYFRVVDDESNGSTNFAHFLMNTLGPPRFYVPQITSIIDSHGHRFTALMEGGSRPARFTLETFSATTSEEFDNQFVAAHADMEPAEFRLVIENPERRDGQPRMVSVQLR